MFLYVHQSSCISPQQTFAARDLDSLYPAVNNAFRIIEPSYEGIPTGILRRMGKAVRMGTGAALPLLRNRQTLVDGIIIGTANGGMEDCIKFLNQIIEYNEGMLTPTNFVQSTTNAIASQIGLMTSNRNYNITHVQRGLAFENALLDAAMLAADHKEHTFLVGGVDEISAYNYNIDLLDGWFKQETVTGGDLYTYDSPGSIAGEGCAMFLVNSNPEGAIACIKAVDIIHSVDPQFVEAACERFLLNQLGDQKPAVFMSGEDGDNRLASFYRGCESKMGAQTSILRFKHMTGEYATVSAVAAWIACHVIESGHIPTHMVKRSGGGFTNNVLIYNCHKEQQHSFILLEAVRP
jgi:hypothetical protein